MSDHVSLALPPSQSRRLARRRGPVGRTALALLAFVATLLGAIVFTLDRVAARTSAQQAATQLAAAARTGAAVVDALHAELVAAAGRLAASRSLQHAIASRNRAELATMLSGRDAAVRTGDVVAGSVRRPSLVATASIASRGRLVARVSVGLPLDDAALARIRRRVSLPPSADLLLLRDGRVIAGGPRGAAATARRGRLELAGTSYLVWSAELGVDHLALAVIEPSADVSARADAFQRRTAIAALLTLLLAGALTVPLARPLARMLSELSDGADRDPLTGLANRRAFDARVAEELDRAHRYHTHLALVLVDLDHFKQVNDRHGHQTGDELLRAFAAAVSRCLRELDLAARFGGEEFALVLPGAHTDDACRLAEQIRAAVAELELFDPAGERVRVTASFGAADFPSCATVEELVGAADRRLYQAKRLGRNRVVGSDDDYGP